LAIAILVKDIDALESY